MVSLSQVNFVSVTTRADKETKKGREIRLYSILGASESPEALGYC